MVARLEHSAERHFSGDGSSWLGRGLFDGKGLSTSPEVNALVATDDIYPASLARTATPTAFAGLDLKAIQGQLDGAKSFKFTTAADNKDANAQPDYYLDSAGQLHINPNKTQPSSDGSVNIQLQGGDSGTREAMKAANENQKQSIREMIRYFQKNNPNAQVPLEWLWKLDNVDHNLPPEQSAPRREASPPPATNGPAYESSPASGFGGSPGGGGGGGRPRAHFSDIQNDVQNGSDLFQPERNFKAPKLPAPIAGDMNVEGPSTISPQQIDKILADFHSPAQGVGQYLCDKGKEYGINPAVALAFFVQESGCGTAGVARHTKSWGNIKGTGSAGSYKGFRAYHDYKEGIDDWYKLIKEKYVDKWGLKTVGSILEKYAPRSENNTSAYVHNVKGMVQGWAKNENNTSLA